MDVLRMNRRTRKCAVKSCRKPFTPYRGFENWCSPECGALIALDKKAKQEAKQARLEARQAAEERKLTRERKQQLKRLPEIAEDTQKIVNRYIKARDFGNPCISCGKPYESTFQAGHYRSVGAAKHLRYDERNIHGQCIKCNMHLSANLIEYRKGLVKKIGLDQVESLENDNAIKKWTREELLEKQTTYRQKLKAIKKC